MHDLDRAMFEYEADRERSDESEHQDFLGVLSGLLGGELNETTYEQEADSRAGELELASELLEVASEAELDRFIADLVRRAGGAVRDFAGSDAGRALGGIIKHAAGQALPVIGKAIGGAVSPAGADIGERVGQAAGSYFGLELEGLSGEDREFEIARALIRFALEACRQAAQLQGPPVAVARSAATTAAQQFAPGLLPALQQPAGKPPTSTHPSASTPPVGGPSTSGRWVRRGNHVVILGI